MSELLLQTGKQNSCIVNVAYKDNATDKYKTDVGEIYKNFSSESFDYYEIDWSDLRVFLNEHQESFVEFIKERTIK